MKKLLILLGLIPSLLFAAAGDVKISVKNSSNTAWIDTIIAQANSELVGMNSSGTLGGITIGTGLTMVGGTLQASGGVGSGTVVGPGSSTTNAIATYGNTSGTLLVNTGWTISGAALTGPTNGTITNLDSITATAATALTLNAGSGNQNVVLAPTGTGGAAITYATTNNVLQRALSINFDALGSGAPQAAIAVNMATAAEGATVYKMGIGFERTNSFGRGWMNFFNNTTADTSNFAGQNGAGGGGANLGDIVMSLSPLRNVIIGSTADFGSGSYQLKVAGQAVFRSGLADQVSVGPLGSGGGAIQFGNTTTATLYQDGAAVNGLNTTAYFKVTNSTASTNPSTGALVINNKIGLGGDGSAYFGGTVTSNGTLASGTYSVDISGASGAARSVLRAGIAAVTNGFTVAYDGTNMQYGFAGSGSTTTIGGALGVTGLATFSNNVAAVAFNGTDSLNLTRATTSANLQTTYTTTTGGNNWTVGLRASDSLLHLYDNTAGKDALTFAASTQAAVFGGNVTAGGTIVHKGYTFATLPSATIGGVVYITDATNAAGTGIGTVPTGGGSVKRMVYSDGTSWLLL